MFLFGRKKKETTDSGVDLAGSVDCSEVWRYFDEICAIPHGSGNTKNISKYIAEFAKNNFLEYRRDDAGNVIIFKPAQHSGSKNAIILQSHMDMVCVKKDDCDLDFLTQGLRTVKKGDIISAEGTTLGADDGIGVAIMLALLADKTAVHPPIDAIFTVDEEIGMLGADFLDVSDIRGRAMINLDSGQEGLFLAGCAGGIHCELTHPLEFVSVRAARAVINISGLKGGHSGVEIGAGRANAIKLLARMLDELSLKYKLNIVSASGGVRDNAIPSAARAEVAGDPGDIAALKAECERYTELFRDEYAPEECGIRIEGEISGNVAEDCRVMKKACADSLVALLVSLPDGVLKMNSFITDQVETSLNIGVLETGENEARAAVLCRSSDSSQLEATARRVELTAKGFDTVTQTKGTYPAWPYLSESRLRDTLVRVYKGRFGKLPRISTVHAGLECGLFAEKINGLDAVSLGPNEYDVHSVNERLSISSTERTYSFLVDALRNLA